VFYKPYESQGEAWPITYNRLIWGIMIFQIFMTGIFILSKGYILASLMSPLLAGTFFWSVYTAKAFEPLSRYVNLSSVFEVQRGEDTEEVIRMRAGHPVTWSQSNLSRRRYAQNDETLYVAPEDDRTDYSQPPMANWYNGVLNTGRRRYAHPALNGVLPQPWLPLKKGQTLVNRENSVSNGAKNEAVVLTLRKRYSTIRRGSRNVTSVAGNSTGSHPGDRSGSYTDEIPVLDPWSETRTNVPRRAATHPRLAHRLSFDDASGVIVLPEEAQWMMEDIDSDSDDDSGAAPSTNSQNDSAGETSRADVAPEPTPPAPRSTLSPSKQRYGTYYHHPERRRQTIPGAFPQS